MRPERSEAEADPHCPRDLFPDKRAGIVDLWDERPPKRTRFSAIP